MNRLSFLFAAVVAASFALSPTPSGDAKPDTATALRNNRHAPGIAESRLNNPAAVTTKEADDFVNEYRKKEQGEGQGNLDVLFVTVPDPLGTHLAAEFDHNVAALQDGIEDSGYLFDSAWIPWQGAQSYDHLADDLLSAQIRDVERGYPGILLFRKKSATAEPAGMSDKAAGLIVFLLAENPTAGISVKQAESAMALLSDFGIPIEPEIRFLGPSFSGSLPSMTPVLRTLAKPLPRFPKAPVRALIRSGPVTAYDGSEALLRRLRDVLPNLQVDIGSAAHQYKDATQLALDRLQELGISRERVAVLTENESQFGDESIDQIPDPAVPQQPVAGNGQQPGQVWRVPFPRDISALRSSYEKQQLLDKSAPGESWKHYLHLSDEDDREGDSIRTFGGQETVAANESVLFGITGFLRSHHIGAVIIVATSEADRYFLTQFLHENNAGVRVVILGATRLFMRGSTTQFRGDMMVSDFPMLARLYDWTSGSQSRSARVARVFPDDSSQGTYVAALDLLLPAPSCSGTPPSSNIPPEYNGPPWGTGWDEPTLRTAPPMYLSALGGDSAWPISADPGSFLRTPDPTQNAARAPTCEAAASTGPKQDAAPAPKTTSTHTHAAAHPSPPPSDLMMPFAFGQHFGAVAPPVERVGSRRQLLHSGHLWQTLFWVLWALVEIYVIGVFYANPIVRRKFAYLQPTGDWRYWLVAVAFPSLLAGCGFLVLAWAHRFPYNVLQSGKDQFAWLSAVTSSVAVPFLMASLCVFKAWDSQFQTTVRNLVIAYSPTAAMVWTAWVSFAWHKAHQFTTGEILAIYREMYWESGLSLVPSALLLLLALLVWAYFAAAGTSLLRQAWKLPNFRRKGRLSTERGEEIVSAARPLPTHRGSIGYWSSAAAVGLIFFLICRFWPSVAAITSLESQVWTHCLLWLGYLVSVFMMLDLLQFAWLWAELRDLLQALDREPLKRSFVPLREFSWNTLWSFSGGSLQDRRNLLAAQFDCLLDLVQELHLTNMQRALEPFAKRRSKYSRFKLTGIPVRKYFDDLDDTFNDLADMGSALTWMYRDHSHRSPAPALQNGVVVNCGGNTKDRFGEEENEANSLPVHERLVERYLCLIYLGFVQTVIVRLRGLAFSSVSLFSLIALSVAVYPFQPMHTFFTCGLTAFVLISATSIVVYSQMDKDPILSRVLNGDPTKLEGGFYGKVIETLAPPLLTLAASVLPGGAGRIIDLIGKVFGHAQ